MGLWGICLYRAILRRWRCSTSLQRLAPVPVAFAWGRFPRKEVIQPQLPLQLPCYDFVPVTRPAFRQRSLAVHYCISGVTSSHDVTGGVYKARERIHRGVLTRGY